MSDTTTGTEKVAGTNLTPIAEFVQSALALADLQSRYKGLVVAVDTPKGMKDAKAATFELRTLRTSLEKKRKDLKAPIIERGKLLDDEAKRLTSEIVALEEPIDIQIKAQEAKVQQELLARQEADRKRIDFIRSAIQAFRDEPSKLVGKPAHIINGALVRLQGTTIGEAFDEFTQEAQDALTAAISHITTMLAQQQAQEAEQAQIKADREKLAKLEREAEERRAADAEREAEQAERDAAEQRRKNDEETRRIQGIHARVETIQGYGITLGLTSTQMRERMVILKSLNPVADEFYGEFLEGAVEAYTITVSDLEYDIKNTEQREKEAKAERDRQENERAEQQAVLDAQREAQEAAQRELDEREAQLKRDQQAATDKAEQERLAGLGLRQAAQAVVDGNNSPDCDGEILDRLIADLAAALANDAKPTAAKKGKKS